MRRFPDYFPQILRPIVYALQNFERNLPNLVAPPTEQICEMFNALQRISGLLTNTEKSFQIDA